MGDARTRVNPGVPVGTKTKGSAGRGALIVEPGRPLRGLTRVRENYIFFFLLWRLDIFGFL
jgi:hypothetical protein